MKDGVKLFYCYSPKIGIMSDMNIDTFSVGPYEVNCSIVEKDGEVFVVDPGADGDEILRRLQGRPLAAILLTHGHFDHIGGVPALQAAFPDCPVYVGERDIPVLTHPLNQNPPDYPPIKKPALLKAAPAELFGGKVLPTPGHTPGGVCYFFPETSVLFSGDTLFRGSVGRTDFPGGDMAALRRSLTTLAALPDDVRVIPGHGDETTIGEERESNPFLTTL